MRNYKEQNEAVKMGEVYIIRCGDLYKIGASRDVKARLGHIQVANASECEIVHRIKSNDMYKTERLLKDRYSALNMRGEWFKLSDIDIQSIKNDRLLICKTDWTRIPSVI